jgi:hypothetical protein
MAQQIPELASPAGLSGLFQGSAVYKGFVELALDVGRRF